MNNKRLILNYLSKELPSSMIAVNHFYNKVLPDTLYIFDLTISDYIGALSTCGDGRFSTNYSGFKLLNKEKKNFIIETLYNIAFNKIEFPSNDNDYILTKISNHLNIEGLEISKELDDNVFKLSIDNQSLGLIILKEESNDFEISLNSFSTKQMYSESFLEAYAKLFNYSFEKNLKKH